MGFVDQGAEIPLEVPAESCVGMVGKTSKSLLLVIYGRPGSICRFHADLICSDEQDLMILFGLETEARPAAPGIINAIDNPATEIINNHGKCPAVAGSRRIWNGAATKHANVRAPIGSTSSLVETLGDVKMLLIQFGFRKSKNIDLKLFSLFKIILKLMAMGVKRYSVWIAEFVSSVFRWFG